MWAGTANPKVDAVVTFYYVMPHGKPDFSKLDAPVLGHFGDSDDFVSVEDAKALEKEIDEATDHDVEFVFYDGAGHAFFNDTNRLGTYHEGHAKKAWDGTVDFFKKVPQPQLTSRRPSGLVAGPALEPHRPVLPVVGHEQGAGHRQQCAGQAVMDPLAADPQAAARNVEADEPITVCPWPVVVHFSLTQAPFRLWRPRP